MPVGLILGDTENSVVVTDLLADLVARGLRFEHGVLTVLDGSKALRKAVVKVFGERALVQRCTLHKRRNVTGISEVMLSFAKDSTAKHTPHGLALALRFVGGNPNVEPQGSEPAPGVINDLRGIDPSRWHTDIAQYRHVVYPDLWPRIDMRLHEQSGVLKYEFHVHPGASPSDIQLAYSGADRLSVGETGGLQIATPLGMLEDSVPLSYQVLDGVRVPVASRYVLDDGANANGRFSFEIGAYQRDRELIIDPGVQYTTFLGGNSAETPVGIAVDSAGSAYVAGTTQSPNFPTTTGAFDRTGAASNFADVFVTKLNPAGTAPVYSTFVGGSDMEFGQGMAIDGSGNAYVTGQTKSSNFPTTGNAFDRSLNIPGTCPRCGIDNTDNFVFKLNAAGSALAYSTYLGGTDYDAARGIAVDGSGNAYVAGETLSGDFATTAAAFDRTRGGEYDMFVTKLNTTGSALVYSTFIGGAAVDNGGRLAINSGGNAYVLGSTSSPDFPTTPGAFDTTRNGAFDATLTKLNAAGSALVYATSFGGTDSDGGAGLVVDSAGNAYVAGSTSSPDFPTTPGAYNRTFNNSDAFLSKFNAAGSALVFSTLVGGSDFDSFSSVVLDTAGNAWLTGGTNSTDFPITAGAPDSTFNGGGDATVVELNPTGSALLFSTFLGGSNNEGGADIARDANGDIYVTGSTFSLDFPVTVGAFDRTWNGDPQIFWGDAFITKIDIDATGSTPPAPPAVPDAPVLVSPFNASSQPEPITFHWNEAAGAVVVHHPDRRLEHVHRPAGARRQRVDVDLRHIGSRYQHPLLARARREHRGCRRSMVRGAQLHTRDRSAALAAVDDRHQPDERRRRRRVQRHPRADDMVARCPGDLLVE